MACPRAPRSRLKRYLYWVATSAFVFGLANLARFLLRTGAKPSRAGLPCQRLAAGIASDSLASTCLPQSTFASAPGRGRESLIPTRRKPQSSLQRRSRRIRLLGKQVHLEGGGESLEPR